MVVHLSANQKTFALNRHESALCFPARIGDRHLILDRQLALSSIWGFLMGILSFVKDEFLKAPVAMIIGLLGVGGGIFGWYETREATKKINELQVKQLLDEAFDNLGGHPGCTYIASYGHKEADQELALRKISTALLITDQSARAHYLKALYHMTRRQTKESIDELNESLRLQPDYVDAKIELASAHHTNKEFDKTLEILKPLELTNSQNAYLLHCLAVTYFAKGQTEMSVGYARRAVGLQGSATEFEYVLATGLYDLGNFDESFQVCQLVINLDPEFGKAWILMALERVHRHEKDAATTALARANTLRLQYTNEEKGYLDYVQQKYNELWPTNKTTP